MELTRSPWMEELRSAMTETIPELRLCFRYILKHSREPLAAALFVVVSDRKTKNAQFIGYLCCFLPGGL